MDKWRRSCHRCGSIEIALVELGGLEEERRDSGTRHDGGETWGDAKRGEFAIEGMDVVPLHTTLLVFKGPVAPSVVTGPAYSRNGAPIESIEPFGPFPRPPGNPVAAGRVILPRYRVSRIDTLQYIRK